MNEVISSISSVYTTRTSSAAAAETKNAADADPNQEIPESTDTSAKYDTLKLSDDYLEYKTQNENMPLQDDLSYIKSNADAQTTETDGAKLAI